MIEIQETDIFEKWFIKLKDKKARGLIALRLERLKYGNFGDIKSVGDGISELRIHYGAGYRIYFTKVNNTLVVLLCGGDKNTQKRDIDNAKNLKQKLNLEQ